MHPIPSVLFALPILCVGSLLMAAGYDPEAMARDEWGGCFTVEGQLAATAQSYLNDAIAFKSRGDFAALQKLIDANRALILKRGVKVFRMGESSLYEFKVTMVKIRLPGKTEGVWTTQAGVQCR